MKNLILPTLEDVYGEVPELPDELCAEQESLESRLVCLSDAMKDMGEKMPHEVLMQIQLEQALVIQLIDETD